MRCAVLQALFDGLSHLELKKDAEGLWQKKVALLEPNCHAAADEATAEPTKGPKRARVFFVKTYLEPGGT